MANNDASSEAEYCVPESEITSSRCIMESFTAKLDFEVTDNAQLKGMRVGEFVTSRVFRVRSYNWVIVFYPSGCGGADNCAGHASAFVCYCYRSRAKPVIAKYTLSVLGKQSQPPAASFDAAEQVFYPGALGSGYHQFVDKFKLSLLSRLGNGRFTVRCVLTIRSESPPLELNGHLEHLLGDAMGADVAFRVGGQEFRAHRSVLAARSPVFRAQFFGPMMEKDDMPHYSEMVDMEPTIFQLLLHYIYTDSLPNSADDNEGGYYSVAVMQQLLVAADRYGVDRLRLICEQDLCGKIDMDTVTVMLALAYQHSCEQLKAACLLFLSSPRVLGNIMETSGFKDHFLAYCRPLPLEGRASGAKGSHGE